VGEGSPPQVCPDPPERSSVSGYGPAPHSLSTPFAIDPPRSGSGPATEVQAKLDVSPRMGTFHGIGCQRSQPGLRRRRRAAGLAWVDGRRGGHPHLGHPTSRLALPRFAVTMLDASAFEVGMLTAATWLPWLLIGLPAGAWVDRLPRRRVMLIADWVSMAAFLSVPIAALLKVLTATQLIAVALAAGTAKVSFTTAYRA
jgi:Transmembrane secretion effector